MLLLIAVLAFVSAAYVLFRLTRQHHPELSRSNNYLSDPPLNARPLFEPTDAELQAEVDEQAARDIARREYTARAEARSAVDTAIANWRTRPDAATAAELLRASAEHGLQGDFSRAAREITQQFHTSGIAGLSRGDLAILLESHIMLLPTEERGSGAIFWLKQEVADLRSDSK